MGRISYWFKIEVELAMVNESSVFESSGFTNVLYINYMDAQFSKKKKKKFYIFRCSKSHMKKLIFWSIYCPFYLIFFFFFFFFFTTWAQLFKVSLA